MSGCGRPGSSSPRCLASSEPARVGAKGPSRAIASPSRGEGAAGDLRRVGQLADHADHRGRVDRAVGPLVVEGDVAADDRDAERLAGVGEAADRAVELPGGRRLLRVAEVEAVGQAERLGADAGEVLGALEHRLDRARVGVAGDAAAVAVDRDRDRVAGLGQLQDRGVGRLGPAHRARADHRVVLLEGPALGGDAGGGEQRQQRLLGRGARARASPGCRRSSPPARPARGRRAGSRRPAPRPASRRRPRRRAGSGSGRCR